MHSYNIFKGKVHVYGDLHLSCMYEGKHKNYTEECYKNMGNILDKVKADSPVAVFLSGDVIGVNERNVRDRQFLMRIYLFLQTLNELTNGNVYSVKGNHDKGDFADFDFFMGIGLIKNPDYVDLYGCTEEEFKEGGAVPEVRFHFVNYGEESRKLSICTEGSSNVVIGHADYLIDGVTNWYSHKGGIRLASLENFAGVELVIAGHIHNPSEEVLMTTIKGDEQIGLFYLGSPARTAERFDDCWYIVFESQDGYTSYDAKLFGLDPYKEVFIEEEECISDKTEEEIARDEENESLTNIVKEIMNGKITGGDLFSQVRRVPHASDRVKDIACDYLQKAIDLK